MAESEGTSFWKTLPGVLTAVSGAIGAIATLLTVLYQVGWIGPKPQVKIDESALRAVRAQTTVQAPRSSTQDVQAPRSSTQDVQAPRASTSSVQAPRSSTQDTISTAAREAIVSQGFKKVRPNVAELEVTYTYDRSRQGVFVDAIILSKGRRISKGSPEPASQSTGRVTMRAVTNPEVSQQSDEVEVVMSELGKPPFLRSRTPWSQTWGP